MTPGLPVKKLFQVAVLSSIILMGALSVAPNVITSRPVTIGSKFFVLFLSMVLTMFLIWCINIGILVITHKLSKGRFAAYKRYILSYVACIALIFFSSDLINSFVHNPESRREHLNAVYLLVS